jgi:8-oxo-dGTP pyrophosphatase MutT (NUDIX family)
MGAEVHEPTHAGGVVHRERGGEREFLLVTARRDPRHWVLPKGHIEPGETAEAAAVREVAEESGVGGTVEEGLGETVLELAGARQRIRWFLLRFEREGAHAEGRATAWLPAGEASERLTFADARSVLLAAVERLAARRGRRG